LGVVDLVVDTDGLRALSATLGRIGDDLDATRGVIGAVRADLGSSELAAALDDFESNWDDGRDQIKENMVAAREILDEAARAYDQTDEDLASSVRENLTGPSTTSTPVGAEPADVRLAR
jgi:Excreted virulence factor EspC, type VII ESX diderm